MARRRVAALLLVLVSPGTTGCSFFMQTAPSEPGQRTQNAARTCMGDVLHPFVDTVSAGVGGYNIVVSQLAHDKVSIYGAEMSKQEGLALGITQAALFGLAATYGYVQFARCRELSREKGFDTTRGAIVNGRWSYPRARPGGAAGDANGATHGESTARAPGSAVDPRHLAPGSEDDRLRRSAPGSEDDRPHRSAPEGEPDRPRPPAARTQAADSTELPSWSAFRRYPLPPENPPRAPAKGSE